MVGENNGGEWSDASRWQGFLHRRYPGVSVVVAAGERPFLARYRSWNLHNIEFAEIHSAVAQDLRVAQPSVQAPDSWYLPLQLSGGFRVGQCEHEFGAEAGSMTILDSRSPSRHSGRRYRSAPTPERHASSGISSYRCGDDAARSTPRSMRGWWMLWCNWLQDSPLILPLRIHARRWRRGVGNCVDSACWGSSMRTSLIRTSMSASSLQHAACRLVTCTR